MNEETQKIFDIIKGIQGTEAYVLVGGTALSMQVQHRYSIDLDFATTEMRLDEAAIKRIIDRFEDLGYKVEFATDPIKIEEAENEGIQLKQYQQDWLINGIKVTFFSIGENEKERNLLASQHTSQDENLKVMDTDGLFITKCIALMNRIKTRDIYDIWWMTTYEGKNIAEVFNVIQDLRPHVTYEMIRHRLLDWPIPITDEGIETDKDISFEEVRSQLRQQVADLEERLASEMVGMMRQRKI